MNMQFEVVRENEDGSVDVHIKEMSPQFHQLLLQEGLIALLTREVNRLKEQKLLPALLRGRDE